MDPIAAIYEKILLIKEKQGIIQNRVEGYANIPNPDWEYVEDLGYIADVLDDIIEFWEEQ